MECRGCSGVIGLHDVCASVRALHGLDDGDCRIRLPDAPCACVFFPSVCETSGAHLGPSRPDSGSVGPSRIGKKVSPKKGGWGRGGEGEGESHVYLFPTLKRLGVFPPASGGVPPFFPFITTLAHVGPLPPPTAPTRHPHEATRREAGK